MVSSISAIYSKNPSPGSPRAGASSWSAWSARRVASNIAKLANATRKGLVETHNYGGAVIQCALSVGSDSASLPRWFGS